MTISFISIGNHYWNLQECSMLWYWLQFDPLSGLMSTRLHVIYVDELCCYLCYSCGNMSCESVIVVVYSKCDMAGLSYTRYLSSNMNVLPCQANRMVFVFIQYFRITRLYKTRVVVFKTIHLSVHCLYGLVLFAVIFKVIRFFFHRLQLF